MTRPKKKRNQTKKEGEVVALKSERYELFLRIYTGTGILEVMIVLSKITYEYAL